MNSTQVLHQQYLKQAGDLSKYDPDQPAEERRKVRRGYRDLQRRLDGKPPRPAHSPLQFIPLITTEAI
jgi:hypothetical protein